MYINTVRCNFVHTVTINSYQMSAQLAFRKTLSPLHAGAIKMSIIELSVSISLSHTQIHVKT